MANGYSLHVGLNAVSPDHYPEGWTGTLQACENDAKAMQRLAVALGYTTSVLLTSQATANAVIEGICAAAQRMSRADIFLLTYSGHGGQVPDTSGDESAADHRDETWCLFDRQLIDDELWALWAQFPKGSRIVVLSDSCHSGTVTKALADGLGAPRLARAEEGAGKGMPPDVQEATYRAHRASYTRIQRSLPKRSDVAVGASIALISGCRDDQVSRDGKVNSLFTRRLLKVWDRGAFTGTLPELRDRTAALMPPVQTPSFSTVGSTSRRLLTAPALRI